MAKKTKASQAPAARRAATSLGDAAKRFLASMAITQEMWRDGLGYDLAALREASAAEQEAIAATLISHSPRDWRDIEALAQVDSDAARAAIRQALESSDPQVRRQAQCHAETEADPATRQRVLIESLAIAEPMAGFSAVLDEAAEFHPPAVVDALFRLTLSRDGDIAVHYAALLCFIHGKAQERFDWSHRPFYLRFNTADKTEREAAFRELCEMVGVAPAKYMS